jgi:galactokinase
VTRLLRDEGFGLRGFDALVTSTLPIGVGLSSSAALTVSLMRALRAAFDLDLDDTRLAVFGQRVENEFVGARVGIMDPMVISLASRGTALFLDCRDLTHEAVTIPAEADLVVVNSGVSHQISAESGSGADYNTRHAECEQACALLGIGQLREIGMADLPRLDVLPDVLRRRARHVITENERVIAAVDALRQGDLARVGELFYASHASMRDDYEISVPEIDLMVELARADVDVYGARLTGGGFGGAVVMLSRQGRGRTVARRISQDYARRSGRAPSILVPAPS